MGNSFYGNVINPPKYFGTIKYGNSIIQEASSQNAALIFGDSNSLQFSITADKLITFEIKEGSIGIQHLKENFLSSLVTGKITWNAFDSTIVNNGEFRLDRIPNIPVNKLISDKDNLKIDVELLPTLKENNISDGIISWNKLSNSLKDEAGLQFSLSRIPKIPFSNLDGMIIPKQIGSKIITSDHIADGAINNSKIQSGAIDGSKIADNVISASKIESNAITTSKVLDGAILTNKIGDGSITWSKLADSLKNGSTFDKKYIPKISMSYLTDLKVGTGLIEDGAITKAKIKNGDIDNSKIAIDAILTNNIKDDSVTWKKLNVELKDVNKSTFKLNFIPTIPSSHISGFIGTDLIDSNAITAEKIQNGAVIGSKIQNGAVNGIKIHPNTFISTKNIQYKKNDSNISFELKNDIRVGSIEANIIKAERFTYTDFASYKELCLICRDNEDMAMKITIDTQGVIEATPIDYNDTVDAKQYLVLTCRDDPNIDYVLTIDSEGVLEATPKETFPKPGDEQFIVDIMKGRINSIGYQVEEMQAIVNGLDDASDIKY